MSSVAGAPPKACATTSQQNETLERKLMDITVPPGPLKMNITHPSANTNGSVFVTSIQDNSPVFGKIFMGDWLLSINGYPVTSRDKCVELFLSTAASTRTVYISRSAAANKDKENSQHTVATVVPTKPPPPTST
jgi:hypothetical protein